MAMDSALLSGLTVLCGSVAGALASIGTTWLTHHYQSRVNQRSQDIARLEKLYSEFINLASTLFGDAQMHSLTDVSTLAPLYALRSQIGVFARSRNTVARAEEVMQRIVDTYHQPNRDFQNHQATEKVDFDVLREFTIACRAELVADR